MHDGRFETLEEVVEFYNSGIQPHPQLAEELRQSGIVGSHLGPVIPDDQEITDGRIVPIRMHMTGEEKAGIVAFLRTLTDYTMITDPKFSDPFQVAE
jgi:cytochrome c peroxidase